MSAVDEYFYGSKSDFARYCNSHSVSSDERQVILNDLQENYSGREYANYISILNGTYSYPANETNGDGGMGEPGNYAASY